MKKSVKLIACLCAAVMLLASGATVISAATAIPPIPTYPYPNYGVFPPYQQIPGIVIKPSVPSLMTKSVTLDPLDIYNIGFGLGVSYDSTNPYVATVNEYGTVYAVAPGTANIIVFNDNYTLAIIKVTVNAYDPDDIPEMDIVTYLGSSRLVVGETTTLYAYLSLNGAYVPFGYELNFYVQDEDVISFDEATGTITAKEAGISRITITVGNLPIYKTITISVVEDGFTPAPSYPSIVPPFIGGFYPGISYPFFPYPELDTEKYDYVYRTYYINGEWRTILVPILKADAEEDKPQEPSLTPEELEALAKAEAEAKRLAELEANIALAKEGKIGWDAIYSDINPDSSFISGVKYVLNNDLLAGNDDGTFGMNQEMTFGDLSALLSKYLNITEEEFAAKNLVGNADAKEALTREDIAVVFYNLAKELKLDVSKTRNLTSFKDYADLDADAADAFAWAVATYIFDVTSTELSVHAPVSKAQLALSLYRLHRLVG